MSLLVVDHGWSVWTASVAAVAAAALIGAVNGLLVVRLGVNTIVVTLGMGTLLLGVALWLTEPDRRSAASPGSSARSRSTASPASRWASTGACCSCSASPTCSRSRPSGRNMRFVGANREVSRLAGVRVDRIRFGAFVTAGVIAGVGGVLAAAAVGGFDPNDVAELPAADVRRRRSSARRSCSPAGSTRSAR